MGAGGQPQSQHITVHRSGADDTRSARTGSAFQRAGGDFDFGDQFGFGRGRQDGASAKRFGDELSDQYFDRIIFVDDDDADADGSDAGFSVHQHDTRLSD